MTRKPVQDASSYLPKSPTLPALKKAVQSCQACDLYRHAFRAVFGAGPPKAAILFIGEQPGNDEDLLGLPFVGPAGKLFDRALLEAGIDRAAVYVTNIVKHFKFEERGKRRLHKKPNASEVTACKPWLEAEISAVRPTMIVCLGATAAQAVLGGDYLLTKEHGNFTTHHWAPLVTATIHPSAILRAPNSTHRRKMYADFVSDLKSVLQKVAATFEKRESKKR
jgi:DNA polymerase